MNHKVFIVPFAIFFCIALQAQDKGRFQGFPSKEETKKNTIEDQVPAEHNTTEVPEAKAEPFPMKVYEGEFKQCLAYAASQRKKVLVEFHASWCLPCKQMEKTTFKDAELQKHIESNYVLYRVDVDDLVGIEVAGKYQVSRLPAMLYLDARGNELKRLIGYQSATELLSLKP